jgi:outer membrane protein TolC
MPSSSHSTNHVLQLRRSASPHSPLVSARVARRGFLSACTLTVGSLLAGVAAADTAPATVPTPAVDVPRPPAVAAVGKDGPTAEQLSFNEAVKRALDRNPTSRQAAEEIRRFHALMEEVRSQSLPTLIGTGLYAKVNASYWEAQATLTVPVLYPRGWVQWQQAGDQVDVARANAADVRRTLAVTTARAYLTIITQKRLLETAIIARDNAKGHFDFTRAQLVGGVGNRLDEVRAAQELTTDEVNLQNQEVALFRAREALGVLVAGDGAMDVTEENLGKIPTLNDALNEAEKMRADVRARKRAAQAADRTVHQAFADYLPYLNFILFPYVQNEPSYQLPGTQGWEAEFVLTVPFYDGGLRYGQEKERKALANEAHLNVEETLRQAKSDVRAAFEEMQRADIALDQAQQSAAFAKQALDLANLAYRAGATTNLEVIDAERQARDAETQAAIAEDASRQARLDLLAASGRFP